MINWGWTKKILALPGVRITLFARRGEDDEILAMKAEDIRRALPDCPYLLFAKAWSKYMNLLSARTWRKNHTGTAKGDLYGYWYSRTLEEMSNIMGAFDEWQHHRFPRMVTLNYFLDVTKYACQMWSKFRLWDLYQYNNGNRGPERLVQAGIGADEWFAAWERLEDGIRHDRIDVIHDSSDPVQELLPEQSVKEFMKAFGGEAAREDQEAVEKAIEQEASGDVAEEEHFDKPSPVSVLPPREPEDILLGRNTMAYPVKAQAAMTFSLTFPCEESIVNAVIDTMNRQYSLECGGMKVESKGGGEAQLTAEVGIEDVRMATGECGLSPLTRLMEKVDHVYSDMMGMCMLQEELVRRAKGAWRQ